MYYLDKGLILHIGFIAVRPVVLQFDLTTLTYGAFRGSWRRRKAEIFQKSILKLLTSTDSKALMDS
jgi:hypothetical protein